MGAHRIIQGVGLQEVLREELRAALLRQAIAAAEMTEFYLVNLLSQYHETGGVYRPEAGDPLARPLALLLLEASEGSGQQRIAALRRLGDTALVIAGLYADRVRKTIVDISYYIGMGGSAYGELAELHGGERIFSELYRELSKKFEDFAEVISIVAPWNHAASDGDLVRIYERWLETGDEKLEALLREGGIPTA